MDPITTQPYTNLLVFRILQCLHGIHTWYPQAAGERTLKFLNNFFVDLERDFKPALPSNLLQYQVQQASRSFAMQLANLTIIHYRKRISDYVQQLCYIEPPTNQMYKAVGRAVTKGREKWGRKLHDSVIAELTKVCQNHLHHNRRDNQYKDAHKRRYGLSCHVVQYKDYTSPFPAEPNFPNRVVASSYSYHQKEGITSRPTETFSRPHPYNRTKEIVKPGGRVTQRAAPPTQVSMRNIVVVPPINVPIQNTSMSASPGQNLDTQIIISLPTTPQVVLNESISLALEDFFDDTRSTRISSQSDKTPTQSTPDNSLTLSLTPADATTPWKVKRSRKNSHQIIAPPVVLIPAEQIPTIASNTSSPLLLRTLSSSSGSSTESLSRSLGSSTESENPLSPTMENYPLPQRASQRTRKKITRKSSNSTVQ